MEKQASASGPHDGALADPLIVSIGENGCPNGPVARSVAHQAPGVLHLAVSLQVVDMQSGAWLLQRRAASKVLFPDHWANACCTHPAPGEQPASAAIRRLREETGLVVEGLVHAGSFTYRAADSRSGLVEHEQDHVFVAFADTGTAKANPYEIGQLGVFAFAEALRLVESATGAPWAAEVLRRSFAALNGRQPR